LEFGQVQRGLLGIVITDVNANVAEDFNLKVNQGVLVNRVNEGSAAEQSGILIGDVIIGIDGHAVNSVSELQEWVARNRPGKEINVTYLRGGERKEVKAKLKNNNGSVDVEAKEIRYELTGLTVEDVPYKELNELQLEGGVRIKNVTAGKWKEAGLKNNFIIAYIDKVPVDNVEDLNRILDFKKGGILIEGFYPGGEKGVYGMEW
jgi:membrane-associated protease RseP (regulator of RpoE activity)